MASSFLPLFLTLVSLFLFLSLQNAAAQPTAPAPGPAGPINLTGILEKGGQFANFIHLLNITQIDKQVNSQVNGSSEGMTVFAPTDNAFQNLKPGTLNQLNTQQQVQLVQYHITPKYYTLDDLLSVSNPVRTQVSGQDGGVFGLNFTGQGNQVNVSTGIVETQINNALRQQFPLAVYVVDKVLLPEELFGKHKLTPPPPPKPVSSDAANTTNSSKKAPAPASDSGSGGTNVGLGLVLGLAMLSMKLLF